MATMLEVRLISPRSNFVSSIDAEVCLLSFYRLFNPILKIGSIFGFIAHDLSFSPAKSEYLRLFCGLSFYFGPESRPVSPQILFISRLPPILVLEAKHIGPSPDASYRQQRLPRALMPLSLPIPPHFDASRSPKYIRREEFPWAA